MVGLVRVIAQKVSHGNGVFKPTHNHPHIPAQFVGAMQQRRPIEIWGGVPYVNEQDGG
jgi:hypothetical protein